MNYCFTTSSVKPCYLENSRVREIKLIGIKQYLCNIVYWVFCCYISTFFSTKLRKSIYSALILLIFHSYIKDLATIYDRDNKFSNVDHLERSLMSETVYISNQTSWIEIPFIKYWVIAGVELKCWFRAISSTERIQLSGEYTQNSLPHIQLRYYPHECKKSV